MQKLSIIIATTLMLCVAGCSDADLKAQGEACVASSECAEGLVCDNNTCQTQLTPQPDAMVTPPADAMVSDAPPGAPDAMVGAPDAMQGTPDATVPDAGVPDAMVPDAMVADAMLFDAP